MGIKRFIKDLRNGCLCIGNNVWIHPLRTWKKGRRYWKKPVPKIYHGRIGYRTVGVYEEDSKLTYADGKPLYRKGDKREEQCGVWLFASWNYLKWGKPKWVQKLFPLTVISRDIGWKDKYNEPRFENPPVFSIIWGTDIHKAWQFCVVFNAPEVDVSVSPAAYKLLQEKESVRDMTKSMPENYWETLLWYTNYCDCDFKKAYRTFSDDEWSTTITDEDGNEKRISLGSVWNPNFMTNDGLAEMNRCSWWKTYKQYNDNGRQ